MHANNTFSRSLITHNITYGILLDEEIPKGFPRFTLQPHMQGVERGRNALIPCKAEGDPDPHIMWLKDMIPIDMSNTRYSYYSGASLQIIGAEEQDQGQYECVAENKVGTAYSDLATLYVRTRVVPPYFSIPPEKSYEVMPGSNMNITCVAVGSPMPYVSWKRGMTDLNTADNMPIGKNVLKLDDIRESANYTCIAHSKLGNIEAITQVIVQSLPRRPPMSECLTLRQPLFVFLGRTTLEPKISFTLSFNTNPRMQTKS